MQKEKISPKINYGWTEYVGHMIQEQVQFLVSFPCLIQGLGIS